MGSTARGTIGVGNLIGTDLELRDRPFAAHVADGVRDVQVVELGDGDDVAGDRLGHLLLLLALEHVDVPGLGRLAAPQVDERGVGRDPAAEDAEVAQLAHELVVGRLEDLGDERAVLGRQDLLLGGGLAVAAGAEAMDAPLLKAKNVVALSRLLVEQHGGEVPRSREALEALPGVGRKTANVVLNIAFAEPTIAVDTHIFRVGNRTGLATGKTPLEVEQKLEQVVPAEFKRHAHHWLILHGRYTCVARKPRCEVCIIADLCKWPGKTVTA